MDLRIAKFYAAAGVIFLILPLLAACGDAATPTTIVTATIPPGPTSTVQIDMPTVSYNFRDGAHGWEAGFADYPPGEEVLYELGSGIRELLPGIEPKGTGYYIAGNNHSDDLFMFLKRHLGPAEGTQPNTTYRVTFKIVFASNAPDGCSGIGGAPGEGVTLKAGGSDVEPKAIVKDGLYRLNVDKGEQATGGPAGSVVGDIANDIPCEQALESGQPYVSLTKEHTSEFLITSSANGDLWLLVGTDSGFEGLTALYYQQIDVDLAKAE